MFYAVYFTSDGSLDSIGTVVGDPLPTGKEKILLDHEPNFGIEEWDPATKSFKLKPQQVPESITVSPATLNSDVGKMLQKLLEKQGVQVKT